MWLLALLSKYHEQLTSLPSCFIVSSKVNSSSSLTRLTFSPFYWDDTSKRNDQAFDNCGISLSISRTFFYFENNHNVFLLLFHGLSMINNFFLYCLNHCYHLLFLIVHDHVLFLLAHNHVFFLVHILVDS